MNAARVHRVMILLLLSAGLAHAGSVVPSGQAARPMHPNTFDPTQRIDVNNLSMVVTNFGSFAYDLQTGSGGLEFPKGSGKTAVFASGLWLGALVNGGVRVTVAHYGQDFLPGSVIGSGVGALPDDPAKPEYKVYKLNRIYPDGNGGIDAAARDAALGEYNAGAVPHGAQPVGVLGDGSLSITGDQMLWSVYNDLGLPSSPGVRIGHNNGSSVLSLGVEVQQTTWAYNRPAPLGISVFTRFKIVNRGPNTLGNMRIAFWVDPDLGGFSDDLTGCDSTRSLGLCYNATNSDLVYGSTPPAVGWDLLQGPFSLAAGGRLPLSACYSYGNGFDPPDSVQAFHAMQGDAYSGAPILDPSSNPTHFMFAGDPVLGTGWVDASPADKRMLLSTGPISMGPNAQQEVVLAILAARGTDRLNSVSLLKNYDQIVQTAFDTSTLDVLSVPPAVSARLSLERAWPNPARGPFSVAFSVPTDGDATLELIDVAGRRVLQRSLGLVAAGAHTVVLGALPKRTPPGVYFIRLAHVGTSVERRLVLLP